jgi:hypothetical protein
MPAPIVKGVTVPLTLEFQPPHEASMGVAFIAGFCWMCLRCSNCFLHWYTFPHTTIVELWASTLHMCILLNTLPKHPSSMLTTFQIHPMRLKSMSARLKSPTIDLFVCRFVPSLNASKLAHAYIWEHPLRSGSHCTPSVASVKTTPMSPTLTHIFLVKKSWHNFWETTLHTKRQSLPT